MDRVGAVVQRPEGSYPQGMAGRGRCCERSYAPFTGEQLKRLVKIAREDHEALFLDDRRSCRLVPRQAN